MNKSFKEKLYLLFEKIKADKKSLAIIIIGLIGMLFISVSELSADETPQASDSTDGYYFSQQEQNEQLEELIGEITGAGRVKVMITYECSQENVFAQDVSEQREENSSKTDNEYIIIDSGSDEEGLLVKEVFPKVMGVAVVCDGGSDPTVKNEITLMIKALFNISSNNISIVPMRN